ncbi:MAG: hypothetical protein GX550_01015 [Syntrophomonadaceae bacterium]|nr:hypothetical protein [Syntrophomonadaceae bacterium]
MKPNRIFIILLTIFLLWAAVVFSDYRQVCHNFNRPSFTIPIKTVDDGGSGLYAGLGYSFDIKGNFMPEDEFPGVTQAKFHMFGKLVKEAVRE